jgi:NAD(P)-dependent dehydrogenase (short-subunit alcohol dehydrogenase family)
METVIITGASRGLGRALARELARRRWRLVIGARGAAPLEEVRGELAALTDVTALAGDVADEAHRRRLIEAAAGPIGLLVNNASALGPSPLPPLTALGLDDLRRVFEANVVAPLRLIQLARPRLRPGACIVNVSSDAAVEGYPGWGGYGASKAALDQLGRVLAAEQPDLAIYAFDPGDMRTQMHQDAFPGEDISDRPPPEERVPALCRLIDERPPSGRYVAEQLLLARR